MTSSGADPWSNDQRRAYRMKWSSDSIVSVSLIIAALQETVGSRSDGEARLMLLAADALETLDRELRWVTRPGHCWQNGTPITREIIRFQAAWEGKNDRAR